MDADPHIILAAIMLVSQQKQGLLLEIIEPQNAHATYLMLTPPHLFFTLGAGGVVQKKDAFYLKKLRIVIAI
jgi:hypothetical protein